MRARYLANEEKERVRETEMEMKKAERRMSR